MERIVCVTSEGIIEKTAASLFRPLFGLAKRLIQTTSPASKEMAAN